MKVLILNTLYPPNVIGGAERSTQALAEGLVAQGTDVVVASTVARGAARTERINGVHAVYLPMANVHWPCDGVMRSAGRRKLWHLLDWYNPMMRSMVAALIRRETPDVVHTNNLQGFSVSAWSAARAARVPVLHTPRDYYLACARALRYRAGATCEQTCWECQPFIRSRRLASNWVDGVVGISRFILERHRSWGFFRHAKLWRVIPHGTSGTTFPAARPVSPVLTFGYLGRVEPAKGLNVLLDAFGTRTDGGWRLLIGGAATSPYVDQLRARYAGLPARAAIQFTGWTDADDFFASIDVLVVPSLWHDPSPRVIFEAAAHGVPSIASSRGGIPEIIDDGVNGLLFDPGDPRTLAAAMDRLIADHEYLEHLRRGAAAHRQPTVAHMTTEYLDAYRTLVGAVRDVRPSG